MTLQQLKYVVAVNRYRNYARAAEACSVTQPTLSAMLMKLETELDVRIFERTRKSVVPTAAGEKIIKLAEKTLADADRIHGVIDEERGVVAGELKLSIGPTIAPYIMPDFISAYTHEYPDVQLMVKDMKVSSLINALLDGSIDAGIGLSGHTRKGIKEIPLYVEPIEVYTVKRDDVRNDFLWVMKEALSLRENTYVNYVGDARVHHSYEATSVEQLVRMVDLVGGSTVIPHMHLRYLSEAQRRNVVEIDAAQKSYRTISLYLKNVSGKQLLIDSMLAVLRKIIPASLVVG
ncbi:LysR family transcriptional regulator [Sodaliphilus sp.]|uniref:LysR family transcriptional regulator n=1 Tax=Sodaliphilus sp. TaxID=2815818 RepID=UPI00388E1325